MGLLRLDLHTHCFELIRYRELNLRIVERLVRCIKEKGLDGIAVTEHNNLDYGYRVKELVDKNFPDQVIIIPGQEVYVWPLQIVELYLPDETIFRFLAHPGYPGDQFDDIGDLHGIELYNPLHNWHIDRERVKELAHRHRLILLANSDAHSMEEIGTYFNEVSLEELCSRARDGRDP